MSKLKLVKQRRYLRPLKFGRKSKKFFVFDTETGIRRNDGSIEYILSARPEHLIFGIVYGPDGFSKVLHSPKEFQDEFKKRRYKNKIVYAHNAEYDLSAVYSNIYNLDRGAIFNGKFILCSNGNCKFADSFNILPSSVKKLGEILGLQKEQLGDADLISNDLEKDIKYCYRDCEIVYKSLEKAFEKAEPSFTIGALALKVFRHKYLKKTIKINPESDLFFDALYGGRTEAFKIGKVKANVYDINSAYVSVMEKNKFPNPARLKVHNNPSIEATFAYLDDQTLEGMITAKVTVYETEKLPVLPFKQDGRLIFPCGEFTGSWTFAEMRYALSNSQTYIRTVSKIVYTPSISSPFGQFARDVWTNRQYAQSIGDKATDYTEKLFGNNLWGKTAQRAKEEFRYCLTTQEARDFMREKRIKEAEILPTQIGFFLKFDNDRLFNHTIACWAAYITSYVRIMLHKEMLRDGDALIYCDTDSRFVEKEYKYTTGKDLGGWKKEDKTVTKIRALKDYVYTYFDQKEEKIVTAQMLKGVKKNSQQLDAEANAFLIERMVRTRESMRRVDGIPPGTFITQLKTLSGDYKKRQIFKDGTSKPFVL